MFDSFKKARTKIINEMTTQGQQFNEQEKFFKEFWEEMRASFAEENNVSSATFILERFLRVLPLHTIPKSAFEHTLDEAYSWLKYHGKE